MRYYWYARGALMLLQSVVGTFIFAYSLKRRYHSIRNGVVTYLLLGTFMYLFGRCSFSGMEAIHPGIGRSMVSLLCFLCLLGINLVVFDIDPFTGLFISASGYIVQDIGGSTKTLMKQIPSIGSLSSSAPGVIYTDLLSYVSCYLICFFAFRPFTRNTNENFDDRVKAAFSIVVLLLTQIMARMTQGNVDRNRMSVIAESLYQILCDIFVLLLQFGVMQHAALNQNVDTMRELVHHQHEQFRQSKDSVDLVNEKYHDLKGLLQNYKGQISAAEMERLQETIGQYDTFVRTGNHVLDIVLAEKRAICNQRGIELTSFMDGSRLLFLEELDLYSLVGNALNNAIDAVSVLPEEERYIILKSNIKGNMVTIHTENPFSGDIKMENALPQSQRDARYHGFGVKSMERTAEKYGGTISVKAEDHMFFLDIILFSKEEG